MKIGGLFDLLSLASLIVLLLGLAMAGVVSAETVAIMLLLAVIALAIARNRGGSLTRLAFRVGLPVAAVGYFAWVQGGRTGRGAISVLAGLALVVVVLFGVYVVVGGAAASTRR